MKKLILTAVLIVSCFSCFSQDNVCYVKKRQYQIQNEFFLEIYQESNDYLFRVVRGNTVYDVLILNNIELTDDLKLDPVKFLGNQTQAFYVLEVAIRGSTFGANQFLVVWKDNDFWSLSSFPAGRSLLVDQDHDDLMEFKGVYPSRSMFYKFSEGLFTPYKPKKK